MRWLYPYPCRVQSCHNPGDDEYHYWDEDGEERVIYLCEDHCAMAEEWVEWVSNVEEEING